ncbi:MAG: hypothetical protein SNJ58_00190 [Aggregatilineales bacterium]
MPHNIDWLIKDHVILLHISGDLLLEEIEAINTELTELLQAGKPPVHLVADVKELGKFPFDLISVRRASTYMQEPNLGMIAVYGTSRIAASFAQLLTSLAGVRMRFVRDYSEALRALAPEDARIKALMDDGKVPTER